MLLPLLAARGFTAHRLVLDSSKKRSFAVRRLLLDWKTLGKKRDCSQSSLNVDFIRAQGYDG